MPVVEDENLHDEEPVAPDNRKRLVGLQATMRLALDGEETRLMLPENPPRLVKVTLDVAEEPAAKTRDEGFTAIPKSTMLMVTLTL